MDETTKPDAPRPRLDENGQPIVEKPKEEKKDEKPAPLKRLGAGVFLRRRGEQWQDKMDRVIDRVADAVSLPRHLLHPSKPTGLNSGEMER